MGAAAKRALLFRRKPRLHGQNAANNFRDVGGFGWALSLEFMHCCSADFRQCCPRVTEVGRRMAFSK
jgi:hypothetical protein